MKKLQCCIILSIFLIVLNCSTPYQPKGLLGGYSDTHLNGNLYKVAFWGNQHTNPEDIDKYLLYRCAELSQEKGYDYFAIMDKEIDSSRQRIKVGGSRQWTGYHSNKSGGSVIGSIRWTEYDFNYVIKLYDEVQTAVHNTYYAPGVLQELSAFVNK